ncbi:MAG: hypothetical protein K2F77_02120, partial [Muribaculaceae bacterium]|nr:hypothetical protein [Muribaculaceae bacterium]
GKYFEGATMIVTGVDEATEYPVEAWKVDIKSAAGDITSTSHSTASLAFTVPAGAQSVTVSSLPSSSSITDAVAAPVGDLDPLAPVNVYDMQGRSFGSHVSPSSACSALAPGIYLFRQGDRVSKQLVR